EVAEGVRQAQVRFQVAVVDRAQFPAQGAVGGGRLDAGEGGHAVHHGANLVGERKQARDCTPVRPSAQSGVSRRPWRPYNAPQVRACHARRFPLLYRYQQMKRPSGRASTQLRSVRITRNYTKHAEGSVLVEFGDTRVICTASVEAGVPRFLKGQGQGWLT